MTLAVDAGASDDCLFTGATTYAVPGSDLVVTEVVAGVASLALGSDIPTYSMVVWDPGLADVPGFEGIGFADATLEDGVLDYSYYGHNDGKTFRPASHQAAARNDASRDARRGS